MAENVSGKGGYDMDIFKAHSVRSASTSAAASTTNDILKSSETVFYRKPTTNCQFGKAVLSSE